MTVDSVSEVGRIVGRIAADKGLMAEADFVRAFERGRRRKPRRWWADRFRSRNGAFADAYFTVGPVSFHLTNRPTEGWAYRVVHRAFDVTVRW